MKSRLKNSYSHSGFTLIELLISMVIMTILGLAVLGLQYILSQNRQVAIENFNTVDRANISVSDMLKEIRTVRFSDAGTYPIESANDNEIIFYSDIDFDNDAERIRYTLNDNVLERGVVEPVGTTYPVNTEKVKTITDLVRNSENPLFTYYNSNWPTDTVNNPLASPPSLANIKIIKIYIRINTEDTDPNNDFILETYATLRTLKDNL